jgi:cyanophycinase
MVLCEFFYNPAGKHIQPGLNLVPRACVLPHHETFGHKWVSDVRHQLPECILVGIDEETGMLTLGKGNAWQVFGKGRVTLYRDRRPERFTIDQTVTL